MNKVAGGEFIQMVDFPSFLTVAMTYATFCCFSADQVSSEKKPNLKG